MSHLTHPHPDPPLEGEGAIVPSPSGGRIGWGRVKEEKIVATSMLSSFRNATPAQLTAALQDARHYTLTLFDRFQSSGLDAIERVPYLPIINPPLWELGHLVWFAEWFVLREAATSHPAAAQHPCLLDAGDRWFD